MSVASDARVVQLERNLAAAFALVLVPLPAFVGSRAMTALGEVGVAVNVLVVATTVAAITIVVTLWIVGLGMARVVLGPLRGEIESVARSMALDGPAIGLVPYRIAETEQLLRAIDSSLRRRQLLSNVRATFLAAILHDAKARVTGIRNVLMARVPVGTADVAAIVNEIEDMQRWLTRSLDASRLDQLEVLDHRERVALHALVTTVVDQVAQDRVSIDVEGEAHVDIDPIEMRRAIGNLVENAVRAARTAVRIEVFPGLVRISDDGTGLPAPFEDLRQPFRRMRPREQSGRDTMTTSGFGLGVFIAARILELHGGRLVCERTGSAGTTMLAYMRGE